MSILKSWILVDAVVLLNTVAVFLEGAPVSTMTTFKTFTYNVGHESLASARDAIDCRKANEEIGHPKGDKEDGYCKRNILGEILLRIVEGVHFMGFQEDSGILCEEILKIQKEWDFKKHPGKEGMDAFLTKYSIPLDSFKGLDSNQRSSRWSPEHYTFLGKNIQDYTMVYKRVSGGNGQISAAYNHRHMKILDESGIQNMLSGRPYTMTLFEFHARPMATKNSFIESAGFTNQNPNSEVETPVPSSEKSGGVQKILMINAHAPHVMNNGKHGIFPTTFFNQKIFTYENMATFLKKTYTTNLGQDIGMVVLQGDLNRFVRSREVTIPLPKSLPKGFLQLSVPFLGKFPRRRPTGTSPIGSSFLSLDGESMTQSKAGDPKGAKPAMLVNDLENSKKGGFIGFECFTKGRVGLNEQARANFANRTFDNILYWVDTRNGRKIAKTPPIYRRYLNIGPASDHLAFSMEIDIETDLTPQDSEQQGEDATPEVEAQEAKLNEEEAVARVKPDSQSEEKESEKEKGKSSCNSSC